MEKDMSLKAYILVLFKWKLLIIGLTIASLIIAGVLSFFVLRPVYRGSAVVYLAQVNNNLLLKAKDVQSQITSDSFIQKIAKDLGVESKVVSSTINVSTAQDSKIVLVNFDSEDSDLIKEFFKNFILELNSFNNQAYQTQIKALKDQKLVFASEVNSLDKQAEDVLALLINLEQRGTSNSEYVLEYSQLRAVYDSIISKKTGLVSQISSLDLAINSASSFFYQSDPLVLDKPVKPRKLFNTAIVGLIAFCLSILLALFFEYWKSN